MILFFLAEDSSCDLAGDPVAISGTGNRRSGEREGAAWCIPSAGRGSGWSYRDG